jgi:hypothetical protein
VRERSNGYPMRKSSIARASNTPAVRMTLTVPKGAFPAATRVEPLGHLPGGGLERMTTSIVRAVMNEVFHLGP